MTRAREIWGERLRVGARVLIRTVFRVFRWLLVEGLWRFRVVWARMTLRARVITSVLILVLISGWTSAIAPSVSATAEALAVLVIGLAGFWMIATSHRRRRW